MKSKLLNWSLLFVIMSTSAGAQPGSVAPKKERELLLKATLHYQYLSVFQKIAGPETEKAKADVIRQCEENVLKQPAGDLVKKVSVETGKLMPSDLADYVVEEIANFEVMVVGCQAQCRTQIDAMGDETTSCLAEVSLQRISEIQVTQNKRLKRRGEDPGRSQKSKLEEEWDAQGDDSEFRPYPPAIDNNQRTTNPRSTDPIIKPAPPYKPPYPLKK